MRGWWSDAKRVDRTLCVLSLSIRFVSATVIVSFFEPLSMSPSENR